MQYRLETSSNEDLLTTLQNKNKEIKKENDDLHREIKACEKIQIEQSKELVKISQEADYYNRIKALNEELRMYKARAKEYQEKCQIEKEIKQEVVDKLRDSDNRLKNLKAKRKQNGSHDGKEVEELKEKVHELSMQNNTLNKKLVTATKRLKVAKLQSAKEIKDYKYENDELSIHLRDKDKE